MSYFSQPKTGREKGRDGVIGTDLNVGAGAPTVAQNSKNQDSKNAGQDSKDVVSTFGSGTLITGNIVCDGCAEIFGRVIGDIQAAQVAVGDGARIEGNITAHEVAINGAFKGIIRAHNVKLKGAAVVDGEIFSKSLTVEENVQFEGLSRRLEKPIELPSSAQAASNAQAPSSAQATSSVQAASSMHAAPSVQTPPSSTQATPGLPVNGGRSFSVATSNPSPISQPGAYSGPFSPTGA